MFTEQAVEGCDRWLSCVSCFEVLRVAPARWTRCSRCGCPVCPPPARCHKSPTHEQECELLSKGGQPAMLQLLGPDSDENIMDLYSGIITTMRVTLASGKKAKQIRKLMANPPSPLEKRCIYWELINQLLPMPLPFSFEQFRKAKSVLNTNSFEMEGDFSKIRATGLFHNASFMTHSCVPNAVWSFSNEAQLVVKAVRDIRPADIITITYVSLMRPSFARQLWLKQSKGFDCTCERCTDPTELGSFLSSICCDRCRRQGRLALLQGLNSSSMWKCQSCSMPTSQKEIHAYMQQIEMLLDVMEGRDSLEKIIETLVFPRGRLHDGSVYIVTLKRAYIKKTIKRLRAAKQDSASDPPSEDLRKAVKLSRELEAAHGRILPRRGEGFGSILLDKVAAMVELLRRDIHQHMAAGDAQREAERARIQKDIEAAELELKKLVAALEHFVPCSAPVEKLQSEMFLIRRLWVWGTAVDKHCQPIQPAP